MNFVTIFDMTIDNYYAGNLRLQSYSFEVRDFEQQWGL